VFSSLGTSGATWHDSAGEQGPAAAQHLRDLAWLRRVRDRIDREYAQPLDVESAGSQSALQASDAAVVQEPTEQSYGVRDCAFRDPAGNLIRIQELR
jgi:catechol 2,3-dioxygenase-like lactoylglutathione lyase family enzyme